jgi:hypothetical protein
MNLKVITYAVLIAFFMLGYNVFLIQRDQKMFDSYYNNHSSQQ